MSSYQDGLNRLMRAFFDQPPVVCVDAEPTGEHDMISHSPAPWRAARGEIVADDGEFVGVVYRTEAWSSGEPVEYEDQANARLISAAPDLLEALKASEIALIEAANIIRPNLPSTATLFDHHAQIARAAIAKAEGTVP